MPAMPSTRTNVDPPVAPGRPRGFDADRALASILAVFWRQGYAATSLDDLTRVTGLSRSSFYACFGSKHAVLMAALQRYADDFLASADALVAAARDPATATRRLLARIADVQGGAHGCLLLNSLVELAPHDPAVAAFGRAHLSRIEARLAGLLRQAGVPRAQAGDRAAAALALVGGAVTLRKAGVAPRRLRGLLAQAQQLALAPVA